MAVTRRVHKIEASARSYSSRAKLEDELNKVLVSGERIVGTHYVDGDWWIITENVGLGPRR